MDNNRTICSECGQEVNKGEVCIIDDKVVCLACMYGDVKPFEIFPIGEVTTDLQHHEVDGFAAGSKKVSRIDLLPSQKRFMYKLEEEPFLLIVYYLHKVNSVRSVFNRRLDGKRVGVFAARTPYRLSKIAVSEVKLLKLEGHTLYVEGLDAIDGSPVLDIKLGLRHGDRSDRSISPGMKALHKECKWYVVCPVKRFYEHGKLNRKWVDRYCYGDWQNSTPIPCSRMAL